ncbi:histidine kinase/DNA gyrase B/HSP90-like ATPase [Ruminiclostridium sufflavum DSM 19573]|uniref:histidine kinase n=1 Tax=Ruminiclostridium sufflavum DSM 19573 TaxID=1121337 RepID=A0A318XHH3_9FIRM|nr:histidine kinase [Ruminiclostridium sufflavum]PYG84311.1 histidine kinase/DNA gyrase B/HSP90-like ATPase [Ruminiclostridium sufflavum DSM 19573]
MSTMQKTPVNLNKWCSYIVRAGHITAALIVLAHVIWYFAARSILAKTPDVYLRYYIILPAIGFFALNSSVGICVSSRRIPLTVKEYLSLFLFIIYSLYLSLTHDIAKVLLCSYILPIFASAIFFNIKLTRRIFFMSVAAVILPGVKMFFTGKLDSDMIMETFVSCFMFLCTYLLTKVLVLYCHDNIEKIINTREEAARNELAFLQAQIKPHFLYNAINTMVSFCYTDSERAASLLVNFSKYLRLIFDIDHKSLMVFLEREVELIKAYVEIEKARFGEKINVEYNIEPELISMEIPSLCLQPLVENAIKHGLCKKDGGGTILIAAEKSKGAVILRVSDTGTGIPAEKLNKLRSLESSGDGVGFSNVSRRVKVLEGAQLDIQSTEGEGTAVTITIKPLLYKEDAAINV